MKLEEKVKNWVTDPAKLCDYAEKLRYMCKVYECTFPKDCIYQTSFGFGKKYCEKELNRENE